MLHHRTIDPAERAWHIAEREPGRLLPVLREIDEYGYEYVDVTLATYDTCLLELAAKAERSGE